MAGIGDGDAAVAVASRAAGGQQSERFMLVPFVVDAFRHVVDAQLNLVGFERLHVGTISNTLLWCWDFPTVRLPRHADPHLGRRSGCGCSFLAMWYLDISSTVAEEGHQELDSILVHIEAEGQQRHGETELLPLRRTLRVRPHLREQEEDEEGVNGAGGGEGMVGR
jgi:hypothetical protein